MLNLFRLFQGGMGGATILPSAAMAEPIVMMDAFALMADFEDRLKNEETGRLLNEDDGIDPVQQAKAEGDAMASWLAPR